MTDTDCQTVLQAVTLTLPPVRVTHDNLARFLFPGMDTRASRQSPSVYLPHNTACFTKSSPSVATACRLKTESIWNVMAHGDAREGK